MTQQSQFEQSVRELFAVHEHEADPAAIPRIAAAAREAVGVTRRGRRLVAMGAAASVLLAAAVAALALPDGPPATVAPVPSATATGSTQLQAAVTAYEAALRRAEPPALQLTSRPEIGVLGPKDEGAGLAVARITAAVALPGEPPPGGVVRWESGRIMPTPLLSSAETLERMRRPGAARCPACREVVVTGARLTAIAVGTAQGPATAPAWEFTLAGISARLVHLAVPPASLVEPLPGTARADGVPVSEARVSAHGRQVTLTFPGAPPLEPGPCGMDYTVKFAEGMRVVAVQVVERRRPAPTTTAARPLACREPGMERHAGVVLDAPLGDRTVLDVRSGGPVPVTNGGAADGSDLPGPVETDRELWERLAGSPWTSATVPADGTEPLATNRSWTVTFRDDEVRVHGACNAIRWSRALVDGMGVVHVSSGHSGTLRGCFGDQSDEPVIALLSSRPTLAVTGDRLTMTADGRTVVFDRTPATSSTAG